jgi:nitrile hydratase subunit beta
MRNQPGSEYSGMPQIVPAEGEAPIFATGDRIRVAVRFPIGHFRVPNYIRGKRGTIVAVIEPAAVNNEEEGYGRNAGYKRHYYRISISMTELWPSYPKSSKDSLFIEVYETWLERIDDGAAS